MIHRMKHQTVGYFTSVCMCVCVQIPAQKFTGSNTGNRTYNICCGVDAIASLNARSEISDIPLTIGLGVIMGFNVYVVYIHNIKLGSDMCIILKYVQYSNNESSGHVENEPAVRFNVISKLYS